MESSTLSFGGGPARPSLVILDEIDGADASGAINALVSIVKAPLRQSAPKVHQGPAWLFGCMVAALLTPIIGEKCSPLSKRFPLTLEVWY